MDRHPWQFAVGVSVYTPFHLASESDRNGFRTRFTMMKSASTIQDLAYVADQVGRLVSIQDKLDR